MSEKGYQAAMREAASAAWDQNWARAVSAYQEALNAQPDDSQALTGLALSLSEAGRLEEALTAYERAIRLVPNDTLPVEKTAQIQERMGRMEEAAMAYLNVAEMYYNRKEYPAAVANWENAARLNADLHQPHMRLAALYEQDSATHQKAIYEYVEMARLLQSFGERSKAAQALKRAARLDPTNPDVRGAMDDLRQDRPIERTSFYEDQMEQIRAKAVSAGPKRETGGDILEDEEAARPPGDEAARHAMGLLADSIWEGQVPAKAQAALIKAIDLHQAGDAAGALKQYSEAYAAGLDNDALRFCLGLLYFHTRQYRDALQLMGQAVKQPDYAVAGGLTLALAALALENPRQAAQAAIDALRQADNMLNESRVDEAGYERLLASLANQPADYLIELVRGTQIFLDAPDWRARIRRALSGFAYQGREGYVPSLTELILEGGRPVLAEIMQRANIYIEQNALSLALEETHYALEKSPDYLPAHRLIADIFLKNGKVQEATEKLNLIGEAYLIRGNTEKAADLFSEVTVIWPADVEARSKLLAMLKGQERVGEALRQYAELGDLHMRMLADPARATAIYTEAVKYATQKGIESDDVLQIYKALADIEAQRLHWKQALTYYEHALKLAPDDEETIMETVDLCFQLEEEARAISLLDNFMRTCITRGQPERIVTTLEEQVRRHPEQVPLRTRLAQVYQRQSRLKEAIAQYDAVGELQLDQGEREAAAATISRIISLNPPEVEKYEQLLEQIKKAEI